MDFSFLEKSKPLDDTIKRALRGNSVPFTYRPFVFIIQIMNTPISISTTTEHSDDGTMEYIVTIRCKGISYNFQNKLIEPCIFWIGQRLEYLLFNYTGNLY